MTRRLRTIAVGIALIGGLVQGLFAGDRRSDDAALFSSERYLANVSYLASDELEGRGTGQEGIDMAADFIAEHFKRLGVEPAGDEGTYFQNFTLNIGRRIGGSTRLAVGTHGRRFRRPLKLHDDFVPFPFSGSGRFEGELVFAGYGIANQDLDYDDYDGLDVADKIVLIIRRAPKFAEFGLRDMAFRSKASRARAEDAAAILIVNPPGDEDGDSLYDFEGDAGAFGFSGGSYSVPMFHVRRAVAERLLDAGGLGNLEDVVRRIEETRQPASAPLEGVTVKGRASIEPVERPVRNVVGLIPGDGPQAEEIIALGAHYDHLGIRKKGQDGFNAEKDISNGADDNASGTALIMTLAEAYVRGERPNRSLLFLLFTGEEIGLLGSEHFVHHPTIDLQRVVAMLNFDMVGRLRNDRLEIGGMRTGGFEAMVKALAASHGLNVKDGGGGRGPSDHTSFYNADIPVMFFFTGLHKQYHQPDDDTPLLNVDGAIRVARFAADVVDEIDAAAEMPTFNQDRRPPRMGRQDDDADDQTSIAEDKVAAAHDRAKPSSLLDGPSDLITAYAEWIKRREAVFGRQVVITTKKIGSTFEVKMVGVGEELVGQISDEVLASLRRLRAGDPAAGLDCSLSMDFDSGDAVGLTIRIESSSGAEPAKAHASKPADPHGDAPDDVTATPMPSVRLGIMPTYGESEGEGYEISGVVEDGPAARAGMKDEDRIYKIGDKLVTDVYSYMDALRPYKAGDRVKVTVIRAGRKLALTIKTAAQKSKEAA